MRTIEYTGQFKKDFKREMKGRHSESLEGDLRAVLDLLGTDAALPERYKDHGLSGRLRGFRDCHVKPDLVLIYRKSDDETLQLVRLGSHSELGL
ncbi:type II toxin-antitoxin system YafQ family toxin [Ralstonia thomasii]|uniref:type II toxin-antitoxin system RelE/ParE family toxin n=1 Tax=Ralstonia thomasii TaxID=3058596 RepID=UPI003C2DCF40